MKGSANARIAMKYVVPKPGEPPDSCQDACEINKRRMLYALADGVSRSFYPSEWASLLVDHFCYKDPEMAIETLIVQQDWMEWLKPIQGEWEKRIGKIIETRDGLAVDIVNRFKVRDPAASTFIGLQILNDDPSFYSWRAVIIGDSVLFHIRQEILLDAYLVKHSSEFSNHTEGFASFAERNGHSPTFVEGDAQPEDSFLLVTDGLASWLLMQHERGSEAWSQAWRALCTVNNWDEFHKLVRRQQNDKKNALAKDDVGLVAVSIPAGSSKQADKAPPSIPETVQLGENDDETNVQETRAAIPLQISSTQRLRNWLKKIGKRLATLKQIPFGKRLSNQMRKIGNRLTTLKWSPRIERSILIMILVVIIVGLIALAFLLFEFFRVDALSNWLTQ